MGHPGRSPLNTSRRALLRGHLRADPIVRPPWARPEAAFLSRCTRCGDCVSACQERVLIVGDGGYPEVDFSRGGCALCGDCADRCREGAFEAGARDPYRAWPHRVSLSDDCMVFKGVECRTCGDVCEQRAIRFQLRVGGAAMPLLDVSACTGCGECLAVCPVRAMQLTVPESNHPGDIG